MHTETFDDGAGRNLSFEERSKTVMLLRGNVG